MDEHERALLHDPPPDRRSPRVDSAAIYADDSDELARLREYVSRRNWDCSGHEYTTGQWSYMLAAADRCVFHAICASVNGLTWFAPVTKAIPFEHVLPKREAPKGPPKGIVTGGPAGAVEFAVRLIQESGPQTLQAIT